MAGSTSCPFPERRRILGKRGCRGRRLGWNHDGYHLQLVLLQYLYRSISVHTCLYWPHLPTPVHTCLVLQISMLFTCTHTCLPWLTVLAHTYLRSFTCDLALARGSLGALRLKVRLTEDRILPSQYYQPLRELLMASVLGPAEVGASLRAGRDLDHGLPLLQGCLAGLFCFGVPGPQATSPASCPCAGRCCQPPGCPGGADLGGLPPGACHQAGEALSWPGPGWALSGLSHPA